MQPQEENLKKKRQKRELKYLGLNKINDLNSRNSKKPGPLTKIPILSDKSEYKDFNRFINECKKKKLIKTVPNQRLLDYDASKIPVEIENISIESQYFNRMQSIDKRMDAFITSKKMDILEKIISPLQKIRNLMYLHIYNEHFNQNNSFTIVSQDFQEPSWSLKIEGMIANYSKENPQKMTHFFKQIVVEFDKEGFPPIEWKKESSNNEEKDGLDITRVGQEELNLTIKLYLNQSPELFKVNELFQRIIGFEKCTRIQAVNALYEYILRNNLFDTEDKKLVICKKEMEELFKVEKFEFSAMLTKIKDFLSDIDPFKIHFTLNLTKEQLSNEKFFKIPLDIDDPTSLDLLKYINTSLYLNISPSVSPPETQQKMANAKKKIVKYGSKIKKTIDLIKKHYSQAKFYDCFEEDPLKFLQNFILHQNNVLNLITKLENENLEDTDIITKNLDEYKKYVDDYLLKSTIFSPQKESQQNINESNKNEGQVVMTDSNQGQIFQTQEFKENQNELVNKETPQISNQPLNPEIKNQQKVEEIITSNKKNEEEKKVEKTPDLFNIIENVGSKNENREDETSKMKDINQIVQSESKCQ